MRLMLEQKLLQTEKSTSEYYQLQALLEIYVRLDNLRILIDSLAEFMVNK